MKKVIVFRVEDVLVKNYDVKGVYGLKMRKMVKEKVGDEFEKELKRMDELKMLRKKGNCFEDLFDVLESLEKRYEEGGDRERMWKIRGVLKSLFEMNDRGDEKMSEMNREYMEEGFEKRKIVGVDVLKDLERIGELIKGFEMVFVSCYKKGNGERLLWNNGLRRFRVVESLGELGEIDREKVVVFGNRFDVMGLKEKGIRCVEGIKDVFGEIGLRKVEKEVNDMVDGGEGDVEDGSEDGNGSNEVVDMRDNCVYEKKSMDKDGKILEKNEVVVDEILEKEVNKVLESVEDDPNEDCPSDPVNESEEEEEILYVYID